MAIVEDYNIKSNKVGEEEIIEKSIWFQFYSNFS